MFIFDVTNPLILVLLLTATLLLIFLGKEIKRPFVPVLPLIFFLVLLLIHSIQFTIIAEDYEGIRSAILGSITVDLVMVFIALFGYLWVDDIACRFYKRKSIDNSLDWFWKKI